MFQCGEPHGWSKEHLLSEMETKRTLRIKKGQLRVLGDIEERGLGEFETHRIY